MTVKVAFFDLGDTLVTASREWVTGAQAGLAILRARGVRLGIISNTDALSRMQVLQALPPNFDLDTFEPDLVLFSSEVGVEKPAVELFQLAVARAGEQAAQCLFCTENLLDTLAAQQAGMRVARLQKPPASDLPGLIDGMVRAHMLI
jgi:FMN phosphatase YigB (HAD superfamily)